MNFDNSQRKKMDESLNRRMYMVGNENSKQNKKTEGILDIKKPDRKKAKKIWPHA